MNHPPEPHATLDVTLDICPMTFVKTKLELEELAVGEVLAVTVRDGEPLHNVSRSCEDEGQSILAREDLGDGTWRLVIRREV